MRRIPTVLGAAALVFGLAAPAAAAVPGAAASGVDGTSVRIEIGAPMGPGPSPRTEPVTVWLHCDPWASNRHPFPAEACAEIIGVKGDVAAIPPMRGFGCVAVYQPVEITVTGTVEGEPVRFTDVESNEGCAAISHGHLFRIL